MAQILIVDDDPMIRLFLTRALQEDGYDIVLARDGNEGLEQAEKLIPDLIVCDWIMPGLDGLEVCRRVKANPNLATTFFVLLTNRGGIADRVKGLDTGADDFLAKPVEVNELKARVRAALRLNQLNRDLKAQSEHLEAELAEAADYVRSLLPPPMSGKVGIETRFIPSQQLGGDCFDYYWIDPEYLITYLLDMSGHGLGAALPSIFVQNLLRSQSLPDVNFYQPENVLSALNEAFQMNDQNDRYFTIWYGVYDSAKRNLFHSSAGHPPAILISPAEDGSTTVQRLRTSGLPIGMLPEAKFTWKRTQVPPDSLLYIFSDGIYEFKQHNGELWSIDDFVEVLAEDAKNLTLDMVLEKVQALNREQAFEDDLSLLQLRFH